MIKTVHPIISLFLLILQFGIVNIYAQDYSQWEIPDGAIARLGKGRINDMEYSPDGSILAVATTIGIWIYDTETYQEQKLFTRSHQEMEKVNFNVDGTVLTGMERFGNKITRWDITLPEIEKSSKMKHDFPLNALYSSDGSTYATLSFKDIHLWDSKTKTSKHKLKGHEGYIGCLSYSPDSKIIASGSKDQTIRLWDVKTGKHIQTLTEHKDQINFLSFSPDGSTLISVSADMTINFWDIDSRELKLTFAIQGVISNQSIKKEKIKRTFFSPDKNLLITAGENRTIHLWDTSTGKLKHTFSDLQDDSKKTGYKKEIENVLFSPDGKSILSLVNDYQIRMWDIATGKRITFTGDTHYLTNATYSPDGKTLATVEYPSGIRIWDIRTGKLKRTISNFNPRYSSHKTEYDTYDIAFTPNGEKAIISESNGTLSLWDTGTKRWHTLIRKTKGSKRTWHQNVMLSPDGETIVSWNASKDGVIRFWNATTGEHKRTIKDHIGPIRSVEFSRDGSLLASYRFSDEDKSIRLWDVATGKHTQTFSGHKDRIGSVVFSPDGETLISGGHYGTILIWDVSTGKHKFLTDQGVDTKRNTHYNSKMVLMFNSDGSKLATGDKNGIIRIWDVSTWKEDQTLEGHANAITSIDFSPDDRSIASTGKDGTVRLWDIDTGQQIQSISCHRNVFWYVMFYPNGLPLATEVAGMNSFYDSEIINLWDLRTGERIKTLAGHSGDITGLSFSDDGNTLVSTGFDDTVLLWDLSSIVQEFDVNSAISDK
ncbi:WD40 repeat domain-containing protein [Candidatus Poribacteria bacterium]|nr:WD40 repeat domain-containing protein [Candidatus Poribacteria bacterium]